MERFHINYTCTQFTFNSKLRPQIYFRHLTVGIFEDKLVCLRLQHLWKHPLVGSSPSWPTGQVTEANMQSEFSVHAIYCGIVHLNPTLKLTRNYGEGGLIYLYEIRSFPY